MARGRNKRRIELWIVKVSYEGRKRGRSTDIN
jgi:hypothetical protein